MGSVVTGRSTAPLLREFPSGTQVAISGDHTLTFLSRASDRRVTSFREVPSEGNTQLIPPTVAQLLQFLPRSLLLALFPPTPVTQSPSLTPPLPPPSAHRPMSCIYGHITPAIGRDNVLCQDTSENEGTNYLCKTKPVAESSLQELKSSSASIPR
ncbi:hypothetical protein Pcinc_003417 [Petrolisthes cinctipes]|uniref:Uncharacterized protein n=1 Tax=Petrolisthes cinctipes TaxID=88211 RepID=A0AAE1GJ09_PETCI|nr:hypothetical protein Pcinc_003417 [Petrolisthes cinctipes]